MTRIQPQNIILSQGATRQSMTNRIMKTFRTKHVCVITAWLAGYCVCASSTFAQSGAEPSNTSTETATQPATSQPAKVSAREAVRLGNKQLIAGDANGALGHYADAEQLEPDAPQIAYVKGLGHFAAENYSQARQAFEKAAASENEQLAGDALYGAGITYHAEALAALDDPKVAIAKLESALERYHTVLAHEPDHQAAKNAGVKAATLRRQLVRQLQQQESESCDNPKESDEKQEDQDKEKKEGEQPDKQDNEKDQEQQDQQQESDEQEKQQSSQDEESQSEDSKQSESKDNDEQQQSDDQESSDSSKQEESSDDTQQQQQQAKQAKENAEEDKKEQAQRRLREMMDAMRNRKKRRPVQPMPTPIKPVDKDW